jgi:multiple sugar transport system permease protein
MRRERFLGYIFLAPMLLFLTGIVAFPLGHAFITSLHRTRGLTSTYIGFANYSQILADGAFWNSLRVSLIFTGSSVFFHVIIGMALALFLNNVRTGRTFLRVAFLTPWMVAPAIGAIIWMWLLEPQFGVFNHLLMSVGIISERKIWLGEPTLALFSVILADVWRGFPFVMLILLAGLQGIPREEYEAAAIEGASNMQMFWYITLPHLRYLLIVATTLDIIDTIRHFDTIAVMTGGGPINATEVLPVLLYNTAFVANRFGLAAAIGVLLLLLVLVFSVVYILLAKPGKAQETV